MKTEAHSRGAKIWRPMAFPQGIPERLRAAMQELQGAHMDPGPDFASDLAAAGLLDAPIFNDGTSTPLIACARHSQAHACLSLLDAGADPHCSTPRGVTAFMLACESDALFPLARRMIAMGADIHAIDVRGQRPLHFAAKGSCEASAILLLDHGACPDGGVPGQISAPPDTPLAIAAQNACLPVIQALCEGGARLDLRSVPMNRSKMGPITPIELCRTSFYRDGERCARWIEQTLEARILSDAVAGQGSNLPSRRPSRI